MTGTNDQAAGLNVGQQALAASWTQTGSYTGVTISATIMGVTTQTITAYLTTQIGTGTSTANEIARKKVTLPGWGSYTSVPLFSIAKLPAGTYYLVISADGSADCTSKGNCSPGGWAASSAASVASAAGVTAGGASATPGLVAAYPPASAFPTAKNPRWLFAVSGTPSQAGVVFSSYTSGNNVCMTCKVWDSGFHAPELPYYRGMPFKAPAGADVSLDSINLTAYDGVDDSAALEPATLVVTVNADADGLPGPVLEQFTFANLGARSYDSPAYLTGSSVLHPKLSAGSQYWLVTGVSSPTTMRVKWVSGNPNMTGLVAWRAGNTAWTHPWGTVPQPLAAFSVMSIPSSTGSGSCSYTLAAGAPNPPSFPTAGGAGIVTVTTGAGCSWSASSNAPAWLSTSSTGSGNGTVNYTVAANPTGNSRSASLQAGQATLLVTQAANTAVIPPIAPAISAGGIVNTASYAPSSPGSGGLAQGSMFSIYGTNLGPDAAVKAAGYPLPMTLAGVGVSITLGSNWYSCPLVFVSKTQVNAIVPSNAPLGRVQVRVNNNGAVNPPVDINVVKTSFGVFFQRVNGSDLAIAQNQDYRLNQPDAPAKPGDVVILWGTGLGAVNGPDNRPLSYAGDMPSVPVNITVGNAAARRLYAGRQAETAAVDNIYFTVPNSVTYGCRVPVVINAGGIASNTTNIAITADGSSCQAPPVVGPCVNIAGQWIASEKGTLTCTVTVNGESVTETDPISGGDLVTLTQQACKVSYTSKSIMAAFGAGQSSRQGQVEGTNVKLAGIMGILAPGFSYESNAWEGNGSVDNNVIAMTGSGTLSGSGMWEGMNTRFSCRADTTATFTKFK